MKIIGLIAEYNPFHNGHLYHLRESRKRACADAVIVVMSGDFVQRGEPALFSKRIRAKTALEAGADIVVELPVCQACAGAEYFAHGAVALLEKLGCVDELWFGSECGEIAPLEETAAVLTRKTDEVTEKIQGFLSGGLSYPAARAAALRSFFKNETSLSFLSGQNNLLGIEYLKAIRQLDSHIKAHTIRRTDDGYHSLSLDGVFCSASALRKGFQDGFLPSDFTAQLPENSRQYLNHAWKNQGPVFADDLSLLFKYKLMSESPETLKDYQENMPGLASKMIKHKNEFSSFTQFCGLLKSKELTYTRISRVHLHILLNLFHRDLEQLKNSGYAHYAHILGFRRESTGLFPLLKQAGRIPLITKLTKTDALSETGKQMLNTDIFASDLYQSILADKYNIPFRSEYQQPIIKI